MERKMLQETKEHESGDRSGVASRRLRRGREVPTLRLFSQTVPRNRPRLPWRTYLCDINQEEASWHDSGRSYAGR
jgi:hypothetical protein